MDANDGFMSCKAALHGRDFTASTAAANVAAELHR